MKRDIQNIDDDIIRKKRIIEQILYSDEDIVEILDTERNSHHEGHYFCYPLYGRTRGYLPF